MDTTGPPPSTMAAAASTRTPIEQEQADNNDQGAQSARACPYCGTPLKLFPRGEAPEQKAAAASMGVRFSKRSMGMDRPYGKIFADGAVETPDYKTDGYVQFGGGLGSTAGDAAMLWAGTTLVLIDLGTKKMFEKVKRQFLLILEKRTIDTVLLIITHTHSDHIGGNPDGAAGVDEKDEEEEGEEGEEGGDGDEEKLSSAAKNIETLNDYLSAKKQKPLILVASQHSHLLTTSEAKLRTAKLWKPAEKKMQVLAREITIAHDVVLTVIDQSPYTQNKVRGKQNSDSMGVLIEWGRHKLLSLGDMDISAQKRTADFINEKGIKITHLKIPHHCSDNNFSRETGSLLAENAHVWSSGHTYTLDGFRGSCSWCTFESDKKPRTAHLNFTLVINQDAFDDARITSIFKLSKDADCGSGIHFVSHFASACWKTQLYIPLLPNPSTDSADAAPRDLGSSAAAARKDSGKAAAYKDSDEDEAPPVAASAPSSRRFTAASSSKKTARRDAKADMADDEDDDD